MKVAVVTGAFKRIGLGITKKLLGENYHLILHRHESQEESISGNKILKVIKADLSKDEGQEELIYEIKNLNLPIDLLVNNASFFDKKGILDISRKDFEYMQKLNIEAPFFLIKELYQNILSSKYKNIINITDALWERPVPKFSHYAASKAALTILTKSLAVEFEDKIRINAVAPGAILPPSFIKKHEEKNIINSIPMKRFGSVEDIANMIVYLTEHCPYVTGQIFYIDGGRSIGSGYFI